MDLVKWTWNDKLGSRGRHPRCMIVSPTGSCHWFSGRDIPGVVRVLSEDYTKNGKWSNSTFSCVSPAGTVPVSWRQDFGTGETLTHDTWEEAFAWFQDQAPHADFESFRWVIRTFVWKNARRLDENARIIQDMERGLS